MTAQALDREMSGQRGERILTLARQRPRLEEEDVAFVDSIGPYAVFEVTGARPRLLGPVLPDAPDGGWAMLCGAMHVFSDARGDYWTMTLRIGARELASARLTFQLDGGCTCRAVHRITKP